LDSPEDGLIKRAAPEQDTAFLLNECF